MSRNQDAGLVDAVETLFRRVPSSPSAGSSARPRTAAPPRSGKGIRRPAGADASPAMPTMVRASLFEHEQRTRRVERRSGRRSPALRTEARVSPWAAILQFAGRRPASSRVCRTQACLRHRPAGSFLQLLALGQPPIRAASAPAGDEQGPFYRVRTLPRSGVPATIRGDDPQPERLVRRHGGRRRCWWAWV